MSPGHPALSEHVKQATSTPKKSITSPKAELDHTSSALKSLLGVSPVSLPSTQTGCSEVHLSGTLEFSNLGKKNPDLTFVDDSGFVSMSNPASNVSPRG